MAISPHLRKNEHPFTAQELNEQSIASPHFRGFPGYPSIVGYQNRGLEFNKFVWCCGTFQAVGTDQDKMTLGDIKFANDAGNTVGEVTLSLVSGTGSNLKLTADDTKNFVGKSASFVYFSQAELDALNADPDTEGAFDSVKAGWYHNTDDDLVECFNDYPIPAGLGFAVKASQTGYSLDLPGAL